MTVDIDPTVPWEYFLCLDFSLPSPTTTTTCFLSARSHHRSLRLAPYSGIARGASGIAIDRHTDEVEGRFLMQFSSIFMKILACRGAGHPVTFLAMLRRSQAEGNAAVKLKVTPLPFTLRCASSFPGYECDPEVVGMLNTQTSHRCSSWSVRVSLGVRERDRTLLSSWPKL